MKSLAWRLTLLGLFVAAAGVAAYYAWTGSSRTRQDAHALSAFETSIVAAERDVLDLRGAQQGYVAAGQGDQFWASKVDAGVARLRESLIALRAQATGSQAQSALDSASSAIQDFEQMDHRAREYARSGQKLLASDLIFANGYELTAAASSALEDARLAERLPYETSTAALERRRLEAAGAAVGVGLVVILLLVPTGVEQAASPEIAAQASPRFDRARGPEQPATASTVDEEWSAARVVPNQAAQRTTASAGQTSRTRATATVAPGARKSIAEPAARDAAGPGAAPPVVVPPGPAIDLTGVAALCSDLARVVDTYALPAILERAAAVLDAPGIVLWIADPDGQELSPIVTHGYPPQLVSRLGTILRDAENATASAFRTSLLQTVRTDSVSNGAIAAPLVTPAGCVGVMAAEVRHSGEADAAKRAVAAIVAAQLATLVGPPSARGHARAEAAGA